ncbi:MAG: hypothetical protein HGA31_02860 [Candidatus Moranbacteria bacterium]|nr:hypothetical protein [Candidatus Moranbacteria bacterium]
MSTKNLMQFRTVNAYRHAGFLKPTLCIVPETTLSSSQQIALSSRISRYARLSVLHPVFSMYHNRGLRLFLRLEGRLEKASDGNVILDMTDDEKETAINELWKNIGIDPPPDGITEGTDHFEETDDFVSRFRFPDHLRIDQANQMRIMEFALIRKVSVLESEIRDLKRSFEGCCADAEARRKREVRTDVTAIVRECMSLTPPR